MIILVDFENTHASGLEGYTYLNENDTLVMYYSDENSAVTRGVVEDLRSNGVHVRLVKLLKQHSNALDMYIASTTGMYLDSGEKICIVSKDHGYAAVRDFWHSLRGAEILLGETIKECFLHSELNDEARIRLCKEREKKATLVEAFTTMNTIPTRPTLSRGAQRRRRNETRNFTEMSEPVAILPNPLVTETPADQLARKLIAASAEEKTARENAAERRELRSVGETASVQEETAAGAEAVSAEAAVQPKTAPDRAASDAAGGQASRGRERNNRRDRSSRYAEGGAENSAVQEKLQEASEPVQERFGGYDGIMKVNEASRIANARRQERSEHARQDAAGGERRKGEPKPKQREERRASAASVISEQPQAAIEAVPAEESKALVPAEKKSTAVAKFDPNRVQFVWDPVTHSMKKVGAPEAEAVQTAASEADEKAVTAAVNETVAAEKETENAEAAAAETAASTDAAEEPKTEAAAESIETSAEQTSLETASDAEETAVSMEQTEAVQEDTTAPTAEAPVKEEVQPTEEAEAISAPTADPEAAAVLPEASQENTAEKPVKKPRSRRARKPKSAETRGENEVKETPASLPEAEENASKPRSRKKKSPVTETAAAQKTRKTGSKKKSSAAGNPEAAADAEGSHPTAQQPEKAVTEASEVITLSPETVQEAKRKYGDGANTLHTYYIRLMKAFGRGQGKAIYEETKKSVQEDIKSRKAQAAAAEAEA